MSVSVKCTEIISNTKQQEADVPSMNETSEAMVPVKNRFLGFLFVFLTSLLSKIIAVFVKKLSYIGLGQLFFSCSAFSFSCALPISVYCIRDVFGARKDRRLLVMRGFLGVTAVYLLYTAYKYLPMGEAAVITSTTPAVTAVAARFCLKESSSPMQIVILVMTICGVLTSVRLPELLSERGTVQFDYYYVIGVTASVAYVFTMSFTIVVLRKVRNTHFSVSVLYYALIGMAENGSINAATSSIVCPTCGWDHVMYILLVAVSFLGNCTMTLSTQMQAAWTVSVQKSSMDIIVAITFQIVIFNESPDSYNIVGACLVLAAVGTLGFRNWLLMLPEESKTRHRLKYFLI